MIDSLILYNTGSRNITVERNLKRRREWRAQGSATIGSESNSPSHQRIRRSRQPNIGQKVAVLEGKSRKKIPPCGRAEGGSQGRQRISGRIPASAWPARRILPPKEDKISEDIDGPRESFHLDGFNCSKVSVRIEWGDVPHVQYWGDAPKIGVELKGPGRESMGSHCSMSGHPVKTTSSVPDNPDQWLSCKLSFHLVR